MKRTLYIVVTVVFAAFTVISCQKKDDDDSTPSSNVTNTDLLVAHSWIMTDLQFEPKLPFPFDTINAFNNMPLCEKDDYYTLKKDGTGFKDRGSKACENEPQSDPLKWEWRNGETELYLTYSDTNWIKDVTISSTTLTGLVERSTPFSSSKITLRATFSKK